MASLLQTSLSFCLLRLDSLFGRYDRRLPVSTGPTVDVYALDRDLARGRRQATLAAPAQPETWSRQAAEGLPNTSDVMRQGPPGCTGSVRDGFGRADRHLASSTSWTLSCPYLHASSPCAARSRSEEHTSELQSQFHLVCRLLLEKKKNSKNRFDQARLTSSPSVQH